MEMSDKNPVIITKKKHILDIGINRPEKKNSLTNEMYLALCQGLETAESDDEIHAIFLHGTQGCFSAGNDLEEFLHPQDVGRPKPGIRFLLTISRMEKPIIAAVNGFAIGIGTTMLLHCDLVYAGESAWFKVPFVNLGLCPEGGSSVLLPACVGTRMAAEMLLLGESVSAREAKDMGLITGVFPDEALFDSAFEKAEMIAEKPPESVRLTKKLMKRASAELISDTIETEGLHFQERLGSDAFKAISTKFLKGKK